MKDWKRAFEKVFVVNLARRTDRWEAFQKNLPKNWPFTTPERFIAVNGKALSPPPQWLGGGGAWGCYRSHLQLIEQAVSQGIRSILLLEDDAIFCEDFVQKVEKFLKAVPENWGMIYLGGQHLDVKKVPPKKVNRDVYIPYNVNRTHAFALQGQAMQVVYRHLIKHHSTWGCPHHIDHRLGQWHKRRDPRYPVYCPPEWLVGQAGGPSNISGRVHVTRLWAGAEKLATPEWLRQPFVVVLGLHSSGSSCIAGICYHLGVFMGNQLSGYYGKDPDKNCGFEAVGLAKLCEQSLPFPNTTFAKPKGNRFHLLNNWINAKRREIYINSGGQRIAGGKYPLLCQMGDQLWSILENRALVINCQRPLADSIRSLQRRCPNISPRKIEEHQRWLMKGKKAYLAKVDPARVCNISYYRLLKNPEKYVRKIADHLGTNPTEEQIQRAIQYVNPEKRHV